MPQALVAPAKRASPRRPAQRAATTRGLRRMHPGRWLRDTILPALKAAGHTQDDIATKLGVTRQTLVNLAGEKTSVTPEMALRLGKLCGNGPDVWMSLQASWDIEQAQGAMAAELARIPTLKVDQAA